MKDPIDYAQFKQRDQRDKERRMEKLAKADGKA